MQFLSKRIFLATAGIVLCCGIMHVAAITLYSHISNRRSLSQVDGELQAIAADYKDIFLANSILNQSRAIQMLTEEVKTGRGLADVQWTCAQLGGACSSTSLFSHGGQRVCESRYALDEQSCCELRLVREVKPFLRSTDGRQYVYMLVGFAVIVLMAIAICIPLMMRAYVSRPISHIFQMIDLLAKDRHDEIVLDKCPNNEFGAVMEKLVQLGTNISDSKRKLIDQSRLVAIGQSTAMVAHDVRKPMTSMKALLMSLAKIKDDPVELNKMISAVDRNIAHTNAMLNDILDFSRDSTALKVGEVNPQGLVVSALSDAFRNHVHARVSVTYDLKHSHALKVDSERIIRVIANIVGNAIEAANGNGASNGCELNIATCEAEGKNVIGVTIADNGPGIPEDVLPRLFDPFFTHGKKGGTGLGLAICRRIITLHGGTIEARNRKDSQGAEFVIELPAGESPATINESELIHDSSELKVFREEEARRVDYGDTANSAEFMRINKERARESYLLIVDDEPLFRETVRGLFADLGQVKDHVRVVEADSAEKGLEMFEARAFDYVIADIDLGRGKLNGYEFSRTLLEKYPDTHVLIHSNKRKAELDRGVREIRSDRFMGFLPKPMRAEELLQFLACKTFEAEQQSSVVGRQSSASEKKNILIVNDDDALLMAFKLVLKVPAVQLLFASNVGSALKHISEQKVDMVLSDINLGDGEPSGYELLKTVREKNKEIPFYMLSGCSAVEEEPKATALGASGFLQMPVDVTQLAELFESV